MRRAYEFFLCFYPREHRDQFAEEMMQVFEQASVERRAQGFGWYFRFSVGEITGLVGGASGAWFDRRNALPVAAPMASHLPRELADAQERVELNVAAMVQAIAHHQFERARLLS